MKIFTGNLNAAGVAPGDDRSNSECINRMSAGKHRRGLNPGRFKIMATLGLALLVMLTLAACSDDTKPEDREFSLTIEDGKLTSEASAFEVKQGDTVTLVLDSDEEGSVHLHGYDIKVDVMPAMDAKLEFVAYATGKYELEFHHGAMDMDEHSHDEEDDLCKAQIPSGAPTPSFTVAASPEGMPGEMRVSVDLENFVLEPAPAGTTLATGHWHLDVDGVEIAMYEQPEITEMVGTAGEHELMATLYDVEHCSYGITAMTTVTLEEGSGVETAMQMEDMDMDEEAEEGVLLGAVEVYPR